MPGAFEAHIIEALGDERQPLPDAARSSFADHPDALVRRAWAANHHLGGIGQLQATRMRLKVERDHGVLAELLGHPQLTGADVEPFARHDNSAVMVAALAHPHLDPAVAVAALEATTTEDGNQFVTTVARRIGRDRMETNPILAAACIRLARDYAIPELICLARHPLAEAALLERLDRQVSFETVMAALSLDPKPGLIEALTAAAERSKDQKLQDSVAFWQKLDRQTGHAVWVSWVLERIARSSSNPDRLGQVIQCLTWHHADHNTIVGHLVRNDQVDSKAKRALLARLPITTWESWMDDVVGLDKESALWVLAAATDAADGDLSPIVDVLTSVLARLLATPRSRALEELCAIVPIGARDVLAADKACTIAMAMTEIRAEAVLRNFPRPGELYTAMAERCGSDQALIVAARLMIGFEGTLDELCDGAANVLR